MTFAMSWSCLQARTRTHHRAMWPSLVQGLVGAEVQVLVSILVVSFVVEPAPSQILILMGTTTSPRVARPWLICVMRNWLQHLSQRRNLLQETQKGRFILKMEMK